ncbi:EAL domain-containing protein [Kutzneria sp. NPDC051319]|uniref:sensor domain-containing protein n=1 Tax=Kutzneria sp. NPDC051319 TaxID=3155047 RepID=UPI00341C16D3
MAERSGQAGRAPVTLGGARLPNARRGPIELGGLTLSEPPTLRVDAKGLVMQANAAAAAMIGATDPDRLGGAALRDLFAGQEPDLRLRRVDGSELPVRVVQTPVPGTGLHAIVLVDVSDLASAAAELREERRRLTDVQHVAGIASWEFDPATGKTVWSDSHYEILGIERGSVEPGAEAVLDLVHPDDVEMVRDYWSNHQFSGEAIDIEYRIVRPDGDVRWLRGEARSTVGVDGRLGLVTGYIRDITERNRTNDELAHERARLVEAQRMARIGSWTLDVNTGYTYRSEVLREMYELVGGSSSDETFMPGVHPDDHLLITEMRDKLLTAQTDEPLEVEIRDVGERVYICRARAQLSSNGKVEQLLGTIQDVTEQRALERELRDERRRLSDAQRVASLGTWEWNTGTDDCTWSGMMRELLGVDEQERATYQRYMSLVHPDDRGWVDELWQQLAVNREPVECEHRIVRPDGLVRVLRCHGASVQGVGPVLVGTAQDVTAQRTAEARMKLSSQRFTDLVAVTPVGIGLFDEAERLVDANDALCDLLGIELEQLRGMTASSITHPDEPVGWLSAAARLTSEREGGFKVPQRILLRPDGELVYCELHIAISVQDDGRRFWLVVFQDITERRRVAESLRHQAHHDELTGLPNRAAVKETLTRLLAGEGAEKIAVLFCDIDNFKRVNDSLGHDAGDELLVALARRLEGGLPSGCTAARMSGDEYVIICDDIDAAGGVEALGTRVASLLRAAVPVHGQLVRVSASIGAAIPNGSRTSGADLLRFADAAMFEAKRRGAGRVSLASAALIASADRQVHLEGQLREALAKDGLTLHFQPVVGVDGTVQTAEALVRWPHPDRGLLAPDAFLPVAEQADMMRELDRWVLRTALREASTWPVPNGKPVAVAVNLSGLVPGDPDFVDAVSNAVAESGIAWDRVVLELVETALVDLPCKTMQQMDILVAKGVRFAVDDFGTGYSSLARLKDLPAQIIKVDRRFVSGVGNDPSDFAVARAVVDMARAMGRSCVAEGVETATQFHVLHGVGVDAYQGWLFSRPVPPREFRAILALGPLHVPRAG